MRFAHIILFYLCWNYKKSINFCKDFSIQIWNFRKAMYDLGLAASKFNIGGEHMARTVFHDDDLRCRCKLAVLVCKVYHIFSGHLGIDTCKCCIRLVHMLRTPTLVDIIRLHSLTLLQLGNWILIIIKILFRRKTIGK